MKRWVSALLGLLLIAGLAGAVWNGLADDGSAVFDLVLAEVDGEVAVSDGAGKALQAEVGQRLSPADRVATGTDAVAVLGLGSETRIRLGGTSSLKITSVDESGVQVELEDGALQATVRPNSGSVRVGSGGREALATNADFSMGVNGDVIQVAPTRGTVNLSGVDATRVEPGSVATIVDKHAQVALVTEDFLLEVEWPEVRRTKAATRQLSGTTLPSAFIYVDGELMAQADAQGAFELDVVVEEGRNEIEVQAVDLLGHEVTVHGELEKDTLGPGYLGGGAQYGN